jgi:anti-sigma-K factor RskA
VIWDTEKSQCLVLGSFPPALQGKRYQLWLFTPVSKVPAGVLKTDPNGRIFETMRVPQEAGNASAAVVTLEPDSGSEIPTSPYYAAGRIE